jgi:hypothetical protein
MESVLLGNGDLDLTQRRKGAETQSGFKGGEIERDANRVVVNEVGIGLG